MDKNRLKQLRIEKKLRQKDIAQYLDCSRTTYTQYETGSSEPDLNTLSRLADFHDTTIDYILYRTDERNIKETFHNQQIMNSLNNLSPEGRKKAEEYIEMLKTLDEVKGQNITDIRKNG